MTQTMQFGDVLEAADNLDVDEQRELIDVLSRRLAERGRQRIIAQVEEARRELAAGLGRVMTPEEIMREAMS